MSNLLLALYLQESIVLTIIIHVCILFESVLILHLAQKETNISQWSFNYNKPLIVHRNSWVLRIECSVLPPSLYQVHAPFLFMFSFCLYIVYVLKKPFSFLLRASLEWDVWFEETRNSHGRKCKPFTAFVKGIKTK